MTQRQQQEILDRWLARHRGLLFKVVRAHAFTPHDRYDLFLEIAAQVWHSIPNFRSESAVTTWLYRVALHCAMAWRQNCSTDSATRKWRTRSAFRKATSG